MPLTNTCEGCDCLMKSLAPCRDSLYNWSCLHRGSSFTGMNGRIIAYRVPFMSKIERPAWCPLRKVERTVDTPEKYKLDNWDVEKILKRLPNNLRFEDIKEGDILHIPPLLGMERANVRVIKKFMISITCENIDPNNHTDIHLYYDGVRFKFATKLKSADDA